MDNLTRRAALTAVPLLAVAVRLSPGGWASAIPYPIRHSI